MSKMNQKVRKQASKVVINALGLNYYHEIPISELIDGLKKVGVVVLQEDGTQWAGMLLGSDSHTLFTLGDANKATETEYGTVYEEFVNAGLALQWYRCESRFDRKIEVNGYIS